MSFEYRDYMEVFLLIPLLALLFVAPPAIGIIRGIYCNIAECHTVKNTIEFMFAIVAVTLVLLPQFFFLYNGGLSLLSENEADALVAYGAVTQIIEPSEKYHGVKVSHKYGADIYINGEYFFAITCDGLNEGTKVKVTYLPTSHFILSIYEDPIN